MKELATEIPPALKPYVEVLQRAEARLGYIQCLERETDKADAADVVAAASVVHAAVAALCAKVEALCDARLEDWEVRDIAIEVAIRFASAMREGFRDYEKLTWDDIAGAMADKVMEETHAARALLNEDPKADDD